MTTGIKASTFVANVKAAAAESIDKANVNKNASLTIAEAKALPTEFKDNYGNYQKAHSTVNAAKFAEDFGKYAEIAAARADADHDGVLSATEMATLPTDLKDNAAREVIGTTTEGIVLADVKKVVSVAQQLVSKIDVDHSNSVSEEEVNRITTRDDFAARNLLRSSMDRLSWPDNPGPYNVGSVQSGLDVAMDSLVRADKNKDGLLSATELSSASKVAKNLVTFADKHAGDTVGDFRVTAYEKPGTKEWAALAKKEYFGGPYEPMNKPYFGRALLITESKLPNAGLKAAFADLKAKNPGATVEATSYQVNGAPVFYMHAMNEKSYDVRVLDGAGKLLGSGTASANATNPRADWTVRWDS